MYQEWTGPGVAHKGPIPFIGQQVIFLFKVPGEGCFLEAKVRCRWVSITDLTHFPYPLVLTAFCIPRKWFWLGETVCPQPSKLGTGELRLDCSLFCWV